MKKLIFILFVSIVFSSFGNDTDKRVVEIFQNTIGAENAKIIDGIVDYGDKILKRAYGVNSSDKAYRLFLNQIKNNRIDTLDIGLSDTEIETFIKHFERNNLKLEMWSFSKRDGREVYGINYQGKYLKAFENLKDIDKTAFNYFDLYYVGGGISYSLLASGILEDIDDLNTYLLKRIIILDILFRNLTNTVYKL